MLTISEDAPQLCYRNRSRRAQSNRVVKQPTLLSIPTWKQRYKSSTTDSVANWTTEAETMSLRLGRQSIVVIVFCMGRSVMTNKSRRNMRQHGFRVIKYEWNEIRLKFRDRCNIRRNRRRISRIGSIRDCKGILRIEQREEAEHQSNIIKM